MSAVIDQRDAQRDGAPLPRSVAAGRIRQAGPEDIRTLLDIEEASFESDRLSRRSFRHLLTEGNSVTLIDEADGQARGYITLLFRADVSLARVYSIATAPGWLGQGVASALLRAAEELALAHNCVAMRLEIRKDNLASQRLFLGHGYAVFGEHGAYYEDGMDALRFEKSLTARLRPELARTVYYRQTLRFTCGASCLMMAMKAFDHALVLERTLELQIWREATTIFMTAGHGGCGPYGLALAAHRRGYPTEIYVNGDGVLFRESVRSEEKRDVITLVHDDFVRQAREAGIAVHHRVAGTAELTRCYLDGGIALVLISTYRLTRERAPHWVVLTGCDERYFFIHDPDNASGRAADERINMAILKKDFERMARYGRNATKAVVVIYPPSTFPTPGRAAAQPTF
ncbi:GNAT family N-acetyltransferase/peptidase C39 family protein [Massilia aquatica]|uniref:GNAT family N-acetyltransferase n=1 Tax=Massilia aquatica TaxID=2609000 RepID=A0ABX0MIC9_9BURK|nr:GNAT family N-acetyltransferase/peptidase C39 family protein [Massilia aquatica]NHZ44692.1 GNAT family N-acetyltransferase [Massilia aquatica]